MIEKQINQDYLSAFKERRVVEKNLLGVVKGEIQTLKKNLVLEELPDTETIKILQKFAKNLKENMKHSSDSKFGEELEIIEKYLPKQMDASEIEARLDVIIASGNKNIGSIMKEFANLNVDKKFLSELIKTKINN